MNRHLRSALLTLALLALLGGGALARSLDGFVQLATTDLLPEVRRAAAQALAALWVDADVPTPELERLAREGATPELRGAAAQALAARTVTADLTRAALIALAGEGEFAPVRTRAGALLSQLWLAEPPAVDALERTARDGVTEALRVAAVDALAQVWANGPLSTETLLETANEGETPALRRAAAGAAVLRLDGFLAGLDTGTLRGVAGGSPFELERVVGRENAELQAAAAGALAPSLRAAETGIETLEALAGDPSVSPALRAVAGEALGQRLLSARRSRAALEAQAADGATPELRGAAVNALVQKLVEAVGAGELDVQALADALAPEESDALNRARAEAILTLLRPNLIFLTDQPLLEGILRGEQVTVGGVRLDGANPQLRGAAADFLAGLFRQFGAVNRFESPVEELLALAGDGALTPEFRDAAGRALVKFLGAQRDAALEVLGELKDGLDRLVIQGRRGQTEEAFGTLERVRALIDRHTALINTTADAAGDLSAPQRLRNVKATLANFPDAIRAADASDLRDLSTSAKGELSQLEIAVIGAPNTTDDELRALAAEGKTIQVRQAASTELARRLSEAQAAGEIALDALEALARQGETAQLRAAAVPALGEALRASERSDDALLELTVEGETGALRRAAADAWLDRTQQPNGRLRALADGAGVTLDSFSVEARSEALQTLLAARVRLRWEAEPTPTDVLLEIARGDGAEPLRAAAGTLLSERWLHDGTLEHELFAHAGQDQSAVVRRAAANALERLLSASALSEPALFNLLSQYTLAATNPRSSPELTEALVNVLAERFLNPLVPTPAPSRGNKRLGQE